METVVPEGPAFVPSRQVRGELEAKAEQLAQKVRLVGEDRHGDVFNAREASKESVEIPTKMRRAHASLASADDRERSVLGVGDVVDHQVTPLE
jgi:hypothetical protein